MRDSRLVEIAAEIVTETDKAYLLFDGARKAWVPKSVTQDNEDGTFTMPERLAQEKEFI
jgi:hypothetical protein